MRYPAVVTKEGKNLLADFPTGPSCQTFAPPGHAIEREAKEALELWLETHLQDRMLPPRPPRTFKARKGTVLWVSVEPRLAGRWSCAGCVKTSRNSCSLNNVSA